jgi:hypothetical protein
VNIRSKMPMLIYLRRPELWLRPDKQASPVATRRRREGHARGRPCYFLKGESLNSIGTQA